MAESSSVSLELRECDNKMKRLVRHFHPILGAVEHRSVKVLLRMPSQRGILPIPRLIFLLSRPWYEASLLVENNMNFILLGFIGPTLQFIHAEFH